VRAGRADIQWPSRRCTSALKADPERRQELLRYMVTLELPVGEEARKAAALRPKAEK
jgi:hypothetical protein